MDRQQLPSYGRPSQQLAGQQFASNHISREPSVLDAVVKGEHPDRRLPTSKENAIPGERDSLDKATYMKDRLPGRGILRKPEGSDLQALQSKFSSLQDDVLNFNAQKPTGRRESLNRSGIPVPLQPLSWQQTAAAPLQPTDAATAPWRPVQLGFQPAAPTQTLLHKPVTLPHDAGGCQDDDVGLGAPTGKERLVKLPAGSLANTKATKAAQDTFEEATFQQLCTDGLSKQLTRTKDGSTDKLRIQELAEIVKLLRKSLKEMGSRTTGYIENVATIERECAQQVENVTLASETKCRKLEAELAIARSALAAAERDFRNEKAMLGAEVDMQKSEVNRLRCDLERRTAERDCAREEATRNEAARQQLDLDIKELRRQNNQQQREISVNQSEAVQKILEQKVAVENELNSLRDEFNKQSSRMRSLQECVTTLEHEIHDLHRMNTMLEGSLSSRQSLLVHNQDQVDKLKDELALARENLAGLTERAEQLQQELDRNRKEREVLEAFVHEQSAELVNKRDRATALEGTLARDHRAWAEKRLELEASLAALGEQRCSLTREVAELKVALSALLTQKEAADGNAAQLAFDKANLMRENTQLQHSVEFNEDRVKQMEQEAAALRKQVDNVNVDLEASRQLLGEKDARLEQLEGEFAALKEVLGDTASAEGESGKQIVTKLLSKIAALQHAAVEAEAVRRRLHNELVDLRGNIRVYCRLKPHPTPATRLGSDGASIALAVEGSEHRFSYDRVFGPDSTQEQVFGAVSDLVQSALDGFHVCVFSYGQTGAGKTHTMQGGAAPAARGIIPRALEKILATAQKLEQEAEWSYGMGACFIEVYNQTLRDLLSGGAVLQENNAIKHDPSGGHTVVAGAKVVKVHDLEGATELVRQAGEARAVVATAMNASSSRSHCVFMLNITGWHQSTGTRLLGSLCLVDLAGSERLDRSQAEGAAKKEACHINSSLSALGDVFAALSSKAQHVPYRNSKLTYLLQPCLGGNGKTLMFVNINPEPASAGESLCSLRFAAKVNGCETGAKGGARRNVQTLGGGGGSGEGEPSGSSNPAGEARRTEAAGSSARAAGPSGSNAVAPNAAQTRRPVAASQSQQPRQQQPEAKLAPRGRGIPAPTRPSGPPRPAPAVGSAAVAAAQKSQQNTASRAAQPGSARFSLGFPRLPGVDAVSAAGAKRMSLLPQRPGADAGVSRTKASTAARTGAAPVVGTGAGVKRPGSVIPDAAAKRSKS